MKTIPAIIFASLIGFAASCSAALLDREISFSEAEVQEALTKSGPQTRNYGWLSVSLLETPKITLGSPEGQVGIIARIHISLLGNRAVPVDVTGSASIRYDDTAKAFFLENPVAHRVESPAIPKEAEANARQATNNLISAYFKARPLYVLRDDGTPQEATARWLLKSIRITPGKAIATLSTF
jgi:hypothetical protein